jgi:transcription elongation GreA/GreB family factor
MKATVDKALVLVLLRQQLAERLDGLTASQRATQSGAVHAESKQEHPKDTRAIEASYLARGLAERVETLREGVAALNRLELRDFGDDDAIQLGALVGLCDEAERETVCFLAPAGGGEPVQIGEVTVLVVTPRAPLGASLVGGRVDDEIEVELPGGKRWVAVRWLR